MSNAPVLTPFQRASLLIGVNELVLGQANPMVLSILRSVNSRISSVSTPWCAAFVFYICSLSLCAAPKSLLARSFLKAGIPITLDEASQGYDIVIFHKHSSPVLDHVHGHVAFYSHHTASHVFVLGGNQSDCVSLCGFPIGCILAVRRLSVI